MRLTSPKHSVVSRMFVYTALSLGLMNFLCVLCQTQDLDCPTSGSEITIDDIGMTSHRFRFPPYGTNGFPRDFECNWIFRAQSGLRMLLQVRNVSTGNNDDIEVFDTDGLTSLETVSGPETNYMAAIRVSSGDTMTVRLTTDSDTSVTEEFFINVIAGRDSGICPTTNSILPALGEVQFLSSNNFPDRYDSNEECDVILSADEGNAVKYTFEFIRLARFMPDREGINCWDNIQVFNDLTQDSIRFDSCDPFFPRLMGVSNGRNLRIRFKSDNIINLFGFLMRYSQQDIDECAVTPPLCHGNASCVNTEGSFQCTCTAGFTGNGFECQEIPLRRYLLPIFASSLGTGLTGVGLLLALVFAANSFFLPTVWAQ